MKEKKVESVRKRCPRCETRVRLVVSRCPECGLKLHTLADCKGCVGVDERGACLAYLDKNNPILNPDGTCYTRKKLVMTKCEDCRYAAVDEGASCSYDGGGSNRDGSKWWTAYMCNNAESEYHLALLNVTKEGGQVEEVIWGGCNKGVGWRSEAERLLKTCLQYQTANKKQARTT